ncbi:MAG: hypothetical protein H6838_06485 [Planctomycetes bacterium]|nr:hypothetical protein [Planctomycetota bacterium]
MRASFPRFRKVLLAVVIFVVALELVLQLAAFVVSASRPAPAVVDGPSVVCLGDSYTAGIGATSVEHSYPAVLQGLLRSRGHTQLTVVNGGCPGQDSAFLIRQVPALLHSRPQVLCVLMAFNDTWSRPAPVASAELEARARDAATLDYGFEWRWRTGRLLALCLRFAANSWHRTSDEMASAPPAPDGPDALRATDAGFAMLAELDLVRADEPPPTFAPPPAPAVQQRVAVIERQLFSGRGTEVLALAHALAEEHPDVPAVQKTVAVAAHLAGDAARCQTALGALQALAAAQPDAGGENLVVALMATARPQQAISAARAHLQAQPRSGAAAMVLQDACFQLGLLDEFRAAAPLCLRLSGRLFPAQSAMIVRHLATACAAADPARAARLLVAGTLLDGNINLSRVPLGAMREAVTWAQCEAAVTAAQAAPPEVREALRKALRAVYDEGRDAAPWAATLEQHLLEIGRLCRERGVALVVLGYPFPHPELERVQREAAGRLGVPFVPLRERFDEELRTRPREDLFVRNGHCSDAGYELVGEVVAQVIEPLLRR